jgi:hypothetical protein
VETTVKSDNDEFGPLTPAQMVQWLQQEIRDISRSAELRIQDATDFVTAYATGALSEEQMSNRLSIYHDRWGDSPIPGVLTDGKMTNEEIIRRLDNAQRKTTRETSRRSRNHPSEGGHSR